MRFGHSSLAAIGLLAALAMVSCSSQDGGGDAAAPTDTAGGTAAAEKTVTFKIDGMV